jgi:hypothetical protein
MAPTNARSCQPGDITVTPIRRGFMLGRVLPELGGPGPWWEYIKIVTDRLAALQEARRIAAIAQARAWLSLGVGEYAPITGYR